MMAFTTRAKLSSYCFGCDWVGESNFLIRCMETYNNSRCIEAYGCWSTKNGYFSFRTEGSTEIMFCFGGQGKKYAIGNLQLPKDKYLKIKGKLLEEIREELMQKKTCPSLFDLINTGKTDIPEETRESIKRRCSVKKEDLNLGRIETGFQKTAKVLLKSSLPSLDEMKQYLLRDIVKFEKRASIISGVVEYTSRQEVPYCFFPEDRIVTDCELKELTKKHIDEGDVDKISLKNIGKLIESFSYGSVNFLVGKNSNIIDCSIAAFASDCYHSIGILGVKTCAYSFWPRNSSFCFGSSSVLGSTFLINAYYCENVKRGFEVESCNNCQDVFFCHSCDGCTDCMFCYLRRGAHYQIGNLSLDRQQYLTIKDALLEQISTGLNKDKTLKWDVYKMGLLNQ